MRSFACVAILGLWLGLGASCEYHVTPPAPLPVAPDMSTPPPAPLPVIMDQAPHSSTRLKVAYFTGDGLVYPGGLVDLDLAGEVCAPRLASDGKWRCLPIFLDTATQYFVDAACSLPLYARTGEAPKFLTLQMVAGAQVFAPAPYSGLSTVYLLSGLSCINRGTPGALSALTLFSLGGMVPLDTFAEVPLVRGM